MDKRNAVQVNATAMGPLNPNDPYWGRFEGGGSAFGGIDTLRPSERQRDIYSYLQEAREKAIKNYGRGIFAGGGESNAGHSLKPVDVLEANAMTKFARSQDLVLNNGALAMYGSKPEAAFTRRIQSVNSFSYEPRNAYTFGAQYTPAYGF